MIEVRRIGDVPTRNDRPGQHRASRDGEVKLAPQPAVKDGDGERAKRQSDGPERDQVVAEDCRDADAEQEHARRDGKVEVAVGKQAVPVRHGVEQIAGDGGVERAVPPDQAECQEGAHDQNRAQPRSAALRHPYPLQ